MQWLQDLLDTYRKANTKDTPKIISAMVRTALLCADTFIMELERLEDLAVSSKGGEILQKFLQASITIQHYYQYSDDDFSTAIDTYRRTAWRMFCVFGDRVTEEFGPELDAAVSTAQLADFRREGDWQRLPRPNQQWLRCQIIRDGEQSSLVHLNLLTAELRLNAVSIGELPARYRTHPCYSQLLSQYNFEVVPSTVAGMDYATTNTIGGTYTVHLGMRGTKLSVLLVGPNTRALVPPEVFRGLLPQPFVDDYVHWFDAATGTVRFDPIDEAFQFTSSSWLLEPKQNSRWSLHSSDRLVLNMQANACIQLTAVLRKIEDPRYMPAFWSALSQTVSIDLSGLGLSFVYSIGDDHISSKEYQGQTCYQSGQSDVNQAATHIWQAGALGLA
jgi:hypothetical protein